MTLEFFANASINIYASPQIAIHQNCMSVNKKSAFITFNILLLREKVPLSDTGPIPVRYRTLFYVIGINLPAMLYRQKLVRSLFAVVRGIPFT